jgi:tRNA pseudouridine55 synthase
MVRNPDNTPISGFINMNKPIGLTSFQVIGRLRVILGIRKLGHSGVLDKPASGVLPVAVNRATKLFSQFSDFPKVYHTTILFGVSTDTDDAAGKAIAMGPTEGVTERDVKLALKQFIGEISQKPPRYSTTKVDGREFYRMALAGEEVPYKLKRMTVDGIEVLSFGEGPTAEALLAEHPSISADATGFPKLKQMELRIACRGGFYVRSLARDLGDLLGSAGCVLSIVREQVGPFRMENALSFEDVEAKVQAGTLKEIMVPMRDVVDPERVLALDAPSISKLSQGIPVIVRAHFLSETARRRGAELFIAGPDGELAAVVEVAQPMGDNLPLHPKRMLN